MLGVNSIPYPHREALSVPGASNGAGLFYSRDPRAQSTTCCRKKCAAKSPCSAM
jgi:hypothetical protein